MDTKTRTPIPTPKGTHPKVGEDIYVESAWYLSHGVDDFQGGLCKVTRVYPSISGGVATWFVETAERPGYGYNWDILKEKQEELMVRFGVNRGHPDPDNSPESNTWD